MKDTVWRHGRLCSLYLFIYYGYGSFYPLISQYYQSIQLTGTQIGIISAITPVVSMITQPVWGMICDRFQVRKPVLMMALLLAGLLGLLFPAVSTFAFVFLLFVILSIFQSALVPISDSMALGYAKENHLQFGDIRLWGAVGFALAALLTGIALENWGTNSIFISYCAALLLAGLILRKIPDHAESVPRIGAGMLQGVKELFKLPRFVLFLIASFFIYGAINAHNIWFSLYYQQIGGSIAGVGLAFMLFAGSEAPFMKMAGYFVRRYGLELTILLAAAVSAARWLWYSTSPNTTLVIALFFMQGLSVGFYLATAAQFVRDDTPASLQVTALSLFASIGNGLGSMACNLAGGWIKDMWSVLETYLFFGIATGIGLIPLLLIRFGPWKQPAAASGSES
ncbi:MFS transporter [Brevibacillus composti]|uniref:MFS transporter n=1 Tax=Brevibacillus composti TaxID=2796470 RepID=A0A7T5EM44_9BACL|nr:MFS transporter [Brevibacillus composti]QQE75130.1 MFS transporter [Brevibacillus composti]QUO42218.1 MFS transporter [Brevibacillus composti]